MINILDIDETLAFDIESTGLDTKNDRIVEFGSAVFKGGKVLWRGRALVNPGVEIPDEARAVHKIGNERVANCPPFSELLPRIQKKFDECPLLVGYNCLSFDVPMLNAEAARAGSDWRVPVDKVIDLQVFVNWFHRGERPRKLEVIASRLYDVHPSEGSAHSAAVDTQMTGELLMAMVKKGVIPSTLEACLEDQARYHTIIEQEFRDWGPWIYRCRKTQRLRMGAGKNCGSLLSEVPKTFFSWALGNVSDLPEAAKVAFEAARDGKVQDEIQRTMLETATSDAKAEEEDDVSWGGW